MQQATFEDLEKSLDEEPTSEATPEVNPNPTDNTQEQTAPETAPETNTAPTREDLLQKARDLGISFRSNISDDTLAKRIEEVESAAKDKIEKAKTSGDGTPKGKLSERTKLELKAGVELLKRYKK